MRPALPTAAGSRLPDADHDRRQSRAWRRAVALAILGLAAALLLGGLSSWFLSAVALAGLSGTALTFNFHAPGALVRLFALTRTAARYGERLCGHRAALDGQIRRRALLFAAMATDPATRSAGWQLADQGRLTDFLDDVEDLDFAPLRVDLPRLTLMIGAAALGLATSILTPLALLPVAFLCAGLAVAGLRFAHRAEAILAERRSALRAGGAGIGAAHAAVVALRAEARWDHALAPALAALTRAEACQRDLQRAQARLDACAALIGPLAGAALLASAWMSGARAEALLAPVFLAFAWLAFAEPLMGLSRQIAAQSRRRIAAQAMARWQGSEVPALPHCPRDPLPDGFPLTLLPRAPDGRALSETALEIRVQTGAPVVLRGTSGIGKTSTLKQIAGWIGDECLCFGPAGRQSVAERRDLTHLCLHDAAVLSDTIRANLFAPAARDAELWAALDAVELRARVTEAGGLDAWITQELLSLGEAQRLNLARLWLSDRPVLLIDEPLEHLDPAQGQRILGRLLRHHRGRRIVIASHLPLESGAVQELTLPPRRRIG